MGPILLTSGIGGHGKATIFRSHIRGSSGLANRIVVTLGVTIAAAALMLTLGLGGVPRPGRTGPGSSVGQSVDLSSFGPFQIELTPASSQGASVSEQQAVSAAMGHNVGATDASGNLLPSVQVNAQYGLFSDNKVAVEQSGIQTLLYQDVPAWIVTFSGTSVGGFRDGPALRTPTSQVKQHDSTITNTEAVVINAQTGAVLMTLD